MGMTMTRFVRTGQLTRRVQEPARRMWTTRRSAPLPIAREPLGDAVVLRAPDHAHPVFARVPQIRDALLAEEGLALQDGCRSAFVPSTSGVPRGLVVLFHGFSAGPWQLIDFAQRFALRGFDVYVPRLPGHGFVDVVTGLDDPSRIPGAGGVARWRGFIDEVHAEVYAQGPVHVVGLSGGAACALDFATRHGGVASVGLLDPFFAPASRTVQRLVNVFRVLEQATFGLSTHLLRLYRTVLQAPRLARATWNREGHHEFTGAQIFALTRFAQEALARARDCTAPIELVTTSGGAVIDRGAVLALWQNRPSGSVGWVDFSSERGVPHAMVDPRENPMEEARLRVFEILERQIVNGVLLNDLPREARALQRPV